MSVAASPIVVLAILLSAAARVDAQTIEYQPVTLDIQVAGTTARDPQDLNNRGEVVANVITFPDALGSEVIADGRVLHRNGVPRVKATFSCANVAFTNTQGNSINARGDTVGACSMGPLGIDPRHGFLRDRKGHVAYIDFPGATQTIPTGISNDGQVVGFYYDAPDSRSGLYRIHGFKWVRGQFETIDVDLPDTYTMLRRVNSNGQIIGEFTRFTPSTNATLQHGWFLYDHGQFSFPFPDSLEWMGGPAITLADINDDGDIVGTRSNDGAAWNGLFLYRDGTFFSIQLPSDFEFPWVNGMNDKVEIVGRYSRKAYFDPFYGAWVYETHGFVATQATGAAE